MKGDYERVITFASAFNASRSPEFGELVSNASLPSRVHTS